MARLTKKVKHNTYQLDNVKSLAVKRKLGQLEDIEEELGVELSVLFKAIMTTGVKWENEHGFIVELNKEELREIVKSLSKEELEK